MSIIPEIQQADLSSSDSSHRQQYQQEQQHQPIRSLKLQKRYSMKQAKINPDDGSTATVSLTTKLSNRQLQNRRQHSDNSLGTIAKQLSYSQQPHQLCSSLSTNESTKEADRVQTLDDELFESLMDEEEFTQNFCTENDRQHWQQQQQVHNNMIPARTQQQSISDRIVLKPMNSMSMTSEQTKSTLERQQLKSSFKVSQTFGSESQQEEQYQEQLFDNKPNCVPRYAFSVIQYLLQQQKKYQISEVHEINDLQARERAIDILSTMHTSLKLQEETFFLASNILSRFLEGQKAADLSRSKLAVLASASLFISAKYEEIYPPSLRHFASALESILSTLKQSISFDQYILDCESTIINNLGFSLFGPTRLQFFEAFLPLTSIDSAQITFCYYLLELSQFNHSFYGQFTECEIASSVILLSEKFKNISGRYFWSDTLEIVTQYRQHDLYGCVEELYKYLVNVQYDRRVLNVFSKYSQAKYKSVALIDYDLTHNVNNQHPSARKQEQVSLSGVQQNNNLKQQQQQTASYDQQTFQYQAQSSTSSSQLKTSTNLTNKQVSQPLTNLSSTYISNNYISNSMNQSVQMNQSNKSQVSSTSQSHHHHSVSYQQVNEKQSDFQPTQLNKKRSSPSLTLAPKQIVLNDENNQLARNKNNHNSKGVSQNNNSNANQDINKSYDITKYISRNNRQ